MSSKEKDPLTDMKGAKRHHSLISKSSDHRHLTEGDKSYSKNAKRNSFTRLPARDYYWPDRSEQGQSSGASKTRCANERQFSQFNGHSQGKYPLTTTKGTVPDRSSFVAMLRIDPGGSGNSRNARGQSVSTFGAITQRQRFNGRGQFEGHSPRSSINSHQYAHPDSRPQVGNGFGSGRERGNENGSFRGRGRNGGTQTCYKTTRNPPKLQLNELLTLEPDIVIAELNRLESSYNKLLGDPNIDKNTLGLFVQVLGQKICASSSLVGLRNPLVAKVCLPIFLNQLKQLTSDLLLEDLEKQSPVTEKITILKNLLTFYGFVEDTMPNLATDFLTLNISAGVFVTDNLMKNTDILPDNLCKLNLDFLTIQKKIQEFKKRRTEFMESSSVQGNSKTKKSLAELELEFMQPPPDDFRSIPIIPTAEELQTSTRTFLRPNLVTGKYPSADYYLDVHYRLLREDLVSPLRDCVRHYLRSRDDTNFNKKRMPRLSVQLYKNVRILPGLNFFGGLSMYTIGLDMNKYYRNIKWEKSKRLLSGSLLLLTRDDFQSIHFGVVAKRDPEALSKSGTLNIIWEKNKPEFNENHLFLMIECEVYFESYRHVLKALQEIRLEKYPLARCILGAFNQPVPPLYLKELDDLVDFGILMSPAIDGDRQTWKADLLQTGSWPTCSELGMDVSQYQAFQTALTTEFAIIQGPPGTGKTFIGIQIAKFLLANQSHFLPTLNEHRTTSTEDNDLLQPSSTIPVEKLVCKGRPVLVVCYTNHALDQFLEAIIDVMEGMGMNPLKQLIRVGGQTKRERMKECSLYSRLDQARKERTLPSEYLRSYHSALRNRRHVTFRRHRLMDALKGLNNLQGVVNLAEMSGECFNFIYNGNKNLETDLAYRMLIAFTEEFQSKTNWIQSWLGLTHPCFYKVEFNPYDLMASYFQSEWTKTKTESARPPELRMKTYEAEGDDEDEDPSTNEDYDIEELMASRIEEISYEARNEGFVRFNLPYYISVEKTFEDSHKWYEREARLKLKNLSSFISVVMDVYQSGSLRLPSVSEDLIQRVYKRWTNLEKDSRLVYTEINENWAVYFHLVEMAKKLLPVRIAQAEKELIEINAKFEEIERLGQSILLKNAKFVGITTSGASKYNSLVRMMESRMVIVEEAAEVLESQIITSISEYCTHLVLIGDHRQLRPHTTVYRLATQLNLDISLFERMVNNGLNTNTLKVQHRMRPEICELIVPTIYKELQNHSSVHKYPSVQGVASNLYFISHAEAESSEADSVSKSNHHEARFLVHLCRYLILQGYTTGQITILTTYIGQMFLLKEYIRKEGQICLGVRVSVVDNFQGEENDIILLSLVRSNEDNQIGFLKTENRICVAISRAKHGLYIIGNMKSLTASSETWRKINKTLVDKGNVGSNLSLQCQIHGLKTPVAKFEDFASCPEGGCSKICDTKLDRCGHKCTLICHTKDTNHIEYKCQFLCEKKCPDEHNCTGRCYEEPCPNCLVRMNRALPCGHVCRLRCYLNPLDHACTTQVSRILPCNHKKTLECWVDPTSIRCDEMVLKDIRCGHQQIAKCFKTEIKCRTFVTAIIPDCGHEMCHFKKDPDHEDYTCQKDCVKSCPKGHPCASYSGFQHRCHRKCPDCRTTVKVVLDCGHSAKLPCFLSCEEDFERKFKCGFRCRKELPCGHKCVNKCYQECGPCLLEVQKQSIDCPHEMTISCFRTAERHICRKPAVAFVISDCGHEVNVPCKIQNTITSAECLLFCEQPCGQSLFEDGVGCEHTCKGTCFSCSQGRIHQKCDEKCGRTLVCGHSCKFPSSDLCPPCQEKCEMLCEHTKCRQKCGTPCVPCKEPCSLACSHSKCTGRCGEECDRIPCTQPCSLVLKCGHPCVGFCGDPCVPLCRICDFEKLTEFKLLWTEEDEDARFVLLEDCQHAIEKEGLDIHMNLSAEENSIRIKRCPRCHCPIRKSNRYGNILKNCLKDVANVKLRVFGEGKNLFGKMIGFADQLEKLLNNSEPQLEFVINFMKISYFNTKNKSRKFKDLNQYQLESLDNMLNWLLNANLCLTQSERNNLTPDLRAKLVQEYVVIFRKLQVRKLPFSQLEIKQFNREMDRLSDTHQLYRRASFNVFGEYNITNKYAKALEILLKRKPYTDVLKDQFKEILKVREIRTVFAAVGYGANWYKCPNGHYYMIGDCGRLNETSRCPTCKKTIGSSGVMHVVAEGNVRIEQMHVLPPLSDTNNSLPDFLK